MRASILIVAAEGPRRLREQVEALIAADVPGDAEFVIVDDAADPEVRAFLRELEGDVVLLRNDVRTGRAAALRQAACAATGEVCIVIGPTARPQPGFVEPLVAAVAAGAGLAGPVIVTPAGEAFGYAIGRDGSLWPRTTAAGQPGALALDCLAAPRAVLADAPSFDARAGHYEVRLAAHARAHGPLVVASEARIVRSSVGGPTTIAICCRNRAGEVEECVQHCLAHGIPEGEVEILVVDNASTDDTAERIGALCAAHPTLVRLVHAPIPGVAHARQLAGEAAIHPLIAMIDDDARPGPGWIELLRDAFEDPLVVLAGGPIVGLWEGEAPGDEALPRELEGFVGVLDRGDGDREVDPGDCPWGGNWAIRKAALAAVGGFDARLGITAGSHRVGGEEVNVGRRIGAARLGRTLYVAEAAVGHRVGWRLAPTALLVRAYSSGVELVQHERLMGCMPDHLLDRNVAVARRDLALSGLFDGTPLDADAALGRITEATFPLLRRFRLAYALGTTAAAAVDRGAPRAALLGDDDLVVTPAQGAGIVALGVRPDLGLAA